MTDYLTVIFGRCHADFFKPASDVRFVSFRDDPRVTSLLDSMQWMDIYISAHPPYSPRLDDLSERISRLGLCPTAPFYIGLGMLSALDHHHHIWLTHESEVPPEPGWDGSTPVLLRFGSMNHDHFVISMGRCTRQDICSHLRTFESLCSVSDSEDSVPWTTADGPLFITVVHLETFFQMIPRDDSHNCKKDHVQVGSQRRWRLRQLPYREPRDFQISLTRSHFSDDSFNMLEVRLEVVQPLEGS